SFALLNVRPAHPIAVTSTLFQEGSMKFAPGQIVILKSGGPSTTVIAIDENTVECIWLAEGGEFLGETIPAGSIDRLFADDELTNEDEPIEAGEDDDDDDDDEEDDEEEEGDEDEDDEDDDEEEDEDDEDENDEEEDEDEEE